MDLNRRLRLDHTKSRVLKDEFADRPGPLVVPIERFFDGNDDLGSIGCNLIPHPGIDVFRDVLVGLLQRPDVEAVYARIAELDPGDDCWPFSDTVLVFGRISDNALAAAVRLLEPDEVGLGNELDPGIADLHDSPMRVVWWD